LRKLNLLASAEVLEPKISVRQQATSRNFSAIDRSQVYEIGRNMPAVDYKKLRPQLSLRTS
jgi:hypothetical protein